MNWSLETEIEEDILIAAIAGTLDKSAYLSARDEVLAMYKVTSGKRRILMDIQQAILDVTVMDIFEVAASSHEVIPPGIKYAVVFSPKTLPERNAHFGETAATNRGAYLRMFTDIAAARKWLKGESSKAVVLDKG